MKNKRENTFKPFEEPLEPVGVKGYHETQVEDLLQSVGCFAGSGLVRHMPKQLSIGKL